MAVIPDAPASSLTDDPMPPPSPYTPAAATALLPRRHLRAMLRFVRAAYALSQHPGYIEAITPALPTIARFDPGHAAVMMGYDFHLTPEGPRLIEINTNAGGALLAYIAHHPDFALPPEPSMRTSLLASRPARTLLGSFATELGLWRGGAPAKPQRLVILDDNPPGQYLYHEMATFAGLLQQWGVEATCADPAALTMTAAGVFLAEKPVAMIYNRHCDFYLAEPALAGLAAAYLARRVCLTPNPRAYGLLADKRRMILMSSPETLAAIGVPAVIRHCLEEVVPTTRLLADLDPETVWQERKAWVLKPVTAFSSRGVLVGEKMSRKRFLEQAPHTTLAQRLVPPSLTPVPGDDKPMKTDFRLFVYRDRVLGVGARLYRGQVTNLRTPGHGYGPVQVI
ncbi:MAG: hypothetical protein HQL66_06765 [Magnetococcales bacterium]|nr:hypothetical protein [Magnetococcales bacterium]